MNINPILLLIYFYFYIAPVTHSSSTTELLNDPRNGTDTIVRNKRIIDKFVNNIGPISSAIAVGTFAYNLIRQTGGQVTDERKRCVTTVSVEPYESQMEKKKECRGFALHFGCGGYSPSPRKGWGYKIQMCTRNYNNEWHRNTMTTWQPEDASSDFFRSEDTLHINQGTLKWLWFEYDGTHCIKYLAVSCGDHVLDEWKPLNFVIGANELESLYRTKLRGNMASIGRVQRCGPNNAGVRIQHLVSTEISFTVPREALLCNDKDISCIKRHIYFDSKWINCYG